MSRSDFSEKIVLVTGGNTGIGRACCVAFARCGAQVIIAARRQDESLQVVREIEAFGGRACFVETDLVDDASLKRLFEKIKMDFGRLDFAINNAGLLGRLVVDFEELPLDEWASVMDVNVSAVFRCMQEEIKLMKSHNYGVIINMSSIAGLSSGRVNPAYVASKHAVIGLTRAAVRKCGKLGIRVNAICPGVIDTSMTAEPSIFKNPRLVSTIPVGRLGRPEEVAEAALWLCSDLSAFVTGASIVIDGGMLA